MGLSSGTDQETGTSADLLDVATKTADGSNPPDAQGVATDLPFKDSCLSGILAVEDTTTGQIEFLSRWSGLTKFPEIHGSVTTKEASARIGEREVYWFETVCQLSLGAHYCRFHLAAPLQVELIGSTLPRSTAIQNATD
ncbi:hypothetical protein K457DRAFT_25704 [Linnemannia elongata AG-77]|uniref:Uncharacterized protein n=1 Tax=Linnemannia elongata AG-77 TaxID=1314771 RepID=A0A197JCE8_9FUNG|nr:hypothetical protein K457DRAFT_25704 [Linnemannia elongata AG-77]